MKDKKGPAIALAAAIFFGASTPGAKVLLGQLNPQLLAGLLYLGSGIGLTIWTIISSRTKDATAQLKPKRSDLLWFAGAIIFGGILGPLSLMIGLKNLAGSTASLLLNAEGVFTALLAWFVFKENFDRQIFLGMLAIAAGSCLLSWQPGAALSFSLGALAVLGACLCWALDNNLTRNISDLEPTTIAATKGVVAGSINCAIAYSLGATIPNGASLVGAALVGFLGYGVSLVLFIHGLRVLGTARTGAYFSTAPFAGALLSIAFLHEPLTPQLAVAAACMALGVWLHLSESHTHEHFHPAEQHDHMHVHDEHHQHEHEPNDPPGEPHSHQHKHAAMLHTHPHYPDSMHRHEH